MGTSWPPCAIHQPPLPRRMHSNPCRCTECNKKGTHFLPGGGCIPGDMSSHPWGEVVQGVPDKYVEAVCYQPPSQQQSPHTADMLSSETLKEIVGFF